MKHLRKLQTKDVFLFLWLSFLFACQGDPNSSSGQNQEGVEPLRVEIRNFAKQSTKCVNDSVHCMNVSATYPYLSGGVAAITQLINDTILYRVKANMAVFAVDDSEIEQPLEQIANTYILEFEKLMEDSPDYPFGWEISVEGSVSYQSDEVLSVALNTYSFTGGAHPNIFLDLMNFDLPSGKKINLPEVFNDTEQVKMLVEKKFREVRNIDPGMSMADAGFFWGDPFSLPQNFSLQEEGVYFFYNPYEAAAYALGATEFVIPYRELKGLLLR